MDLSKFFILRVLHDGPMHGFSVARSVERMTGGCCSPTEGTIYPALRKFEAGGFVTAAEEVAQGRQRRLYELTDADRARAKRAAEDACCR
jgi:PadR family transcriptional regulator, regulatory protein PadR